MAATESKEFDENFLVGELVLLIHNRNGKPIRHPASECLFYGSVTTRETSKKISQARRQLLNELDAKGPGSTADGLMAGDHISVLTGSVAHVADPDKNGADGYVLENVRRCILESEWKTTLDSIKCVYARVCVKVPVRTDLALDVLTGEVRINPVLEGEHSHGIYGGPPLGALTPKIEEQKPSTTKSIAAELKDKWIAYLPITGLEWAFPHLIGASGLCTDLAVVGRMGPNGVMVPHAIEDNSHVTIATGLPEISEELKSRLSKHRTVRLKVDGVDKFEIRDKVFSDGTKHSYDVLYLKVSPVHDGTWSLHPFHDIAICISEATGVERKYTEVMHATLCYLGPGFADAYIDLIRKTYTVMKFSVDTVHWAKHGDRTVEPIKIPLSG